jgi:CO dehydrogenase maturation factor
MKIAVAGKGGSGKTTVAGTLARILGRRGNDVLALDADTNPMLGVSLGIGPEETDVLMAVRQGIDSGQVGHEPTVAGMIDTFGRDAPDGVRLVLASRIEKVDPGCPCCGVSPEQLLRDLEDDNIVIADLEAGVGTLSRLPENGVDTLLVVTEPTVKSIEVAKVVSSLCAERHPRTEVIVVANRVKSEADRQTIESSLDRQVVVVPEDPSVTMADREGASPVDADDDSPAVQAVATMADQLETRAMAPA